MVINIFHKTIKFNLIIDGNPVRNLDGLRENFNVDDILNYYRNGLLIKWLASRGYTEELSNITAISSEDNLDIISEIADIFRVNIETHQAEELLYLFDCRKEWNASLSQLDKCNFQHQDVIKNYYVGYDDLLKGILNDKDNMALIKSSMRQISENYIDVFRYHLPSFYDEFLEKAPLAIFASLMNPTLRKLLFGSDLISAKISKLTPEISYESLDSSNIKKRNLDTKEYWEDIEPKGKKFMIIGMREGNFVRNAGKQGEILSADDVNGKFPILDGIDYKSNNPEHEIGYLEV